MAILIDKSYDVTMIQLRLVKGIYTTSLLQNTHSLPQAKSHRLPIHIRPHNQRLSTDTITGCTSATAHARSARERDRHRHGASVAIRSIHSRARDGLPIRRISVDQVRTTRVALLAIEERLGDVVVLERRDGPVGQAGHFLDDGFDPDLQQGAHALRADFVCRYAGGAHVGLMKHVGVVAEAEEVAGRGVPFEGEEVGEFTSAG